MDRSSYKLIYEVCSEIAYNNSRFVYNPNGDDYRECKHCTAWVKDYSTDSIMHDSDCLTLKALTIMEELDKDDSIII